MTPTGSTGTRRKTLRKVRRAPRTQTRTSSDLGTPTPPALRSYSGTERRGLTPVESSLSSHVPSCAHSHSLLCALPSRPLVHSHVYVHSCSVPSCTHSRTYVHSCPVPLCTLSLAPMYTHTPSPRVHTLTSMCTRTPSPSFVHSHSRLCTLASRPLVRTLSRLCVLCPYTLYPLPSTLGSRGVDDEGTDVRGVLQSPWSRHESSLLRTEVQVGDG